MTVYNSFWGLQRNIKWYTHFMTNFYKKLVAWTALVSLIGVSVFQTATLVSAQNYTTYRLKCPDYQFTRTLAQSSRGEDVRLIQSILNLDYRTRVAPSGVGSKGYETDLFGVATREALKRFQALFIELIGVADGKFNARTITVMNAVCQGNYFKNGSGGVYDGVSTATSTISSLDKTAPVISISAPTNNYTDTSFRLWIVANEPIQAFSLDKFIVLGGATLSDLRKENPTTYKVLVTPAKVEAHTVSIQLEADSIKDLAGNVNTNASNELNLSLSPRPAGPDVTPPSTVLSSGSLGVMTINTDGSISPANVTLAFSEAVTGIINLSNFVVRGSISISDLKKLDASTYSLVVNSSAAARATGSIQLPAGLVADAAGNKNTMSNEYQFNILQLPAVSTSTATQTYTYQPGYVDSGSGQSSSQNDPMQMLMYLMMGSKALEGLTGLLGKNPFSGTAGTGATTDAGTGPTTPSGTQLGGDTGVVSPCACLPARRRTISFTPRGAGAAGFYFFETSPTVVPGCFVRGFAIMTPASIANICGQQSAFPVKGKCPAGFVPGGYQGCCLNPDKNMGGSPVIGIFPPTSSTFRGCGA